MRSIFLALVITLAIALPAVADRDDYYCVGPDYLAKEFRSFSNPGLAGPHVVKILHFDLMRLWIKVFSGGFTAINRAK